MAFKLIPILQFDGKVLCQGTAIARYLARLYGLSGRTHFEEAQVDSIIDVVNTLTLEAKQPFIYYFKRFQDLKIDLSNPEIRNSIQERAIKPIARYMPFLESACANNYPHGFIFTSGLTFADFAVANIFEIIENFYPESVASYTNAKKLKEKVFALPQLQEYLKRRPNSIM